MPDAPAPLLLAGLGHAHLFVLESLAAGGWPDLPVVLVSPPEYDYSGMISGTVAGQYAADRGRLLPGPLAAAAGARWIPGRVLRVDAAGRRATLDDGTVIPFRLLSLDIGSRAAGLDVPGAARHSIPVRPVRNALRFLSAAGRAAADAPPGRPARVVVVGGGAAGVEIALCLAQALDRHRPGPYRIEVAERGERILAEFPEGTRRTAESLLERRGVGVRTGAPVERVEPERLLLRGGGSLPYDALLWATGPAAPALPRASGLATDGAGFLRVRPDLRALEHDAVFAAGDCAAIEGFPWVARAGVYAVRAGPVLAANLRAALRGEPLRPYAPQRHWLSLMNTGDGRALASWRGLAAHGRLAWWLKDRIDRRFVDRFQRLERAAAEREPGSG